MIGRTLSHYRIEEELGRGGMGVVYRAHDERLRRRVALKVLPEELLSGPERRARILAEARAASALSHPVITTIYEVGEDGDQLFIVMELISGKTLRAMTAGTRLETPALVRIAAQVAEGLAAAHAQGVTHGDVKPENIMVQPDGRVKLLDFGIARQLAAETVTLTRTAPPQFQSGGIAGTLAYLAPEQWRGLEPDSRTDLFSLGVVLYEALVGLRPFPGPSAAALMSQILTESPPRLTAHGIAPTLARVVHRLLEKNPESRYQSAAELESDLRKLPLGTEQPRAAASGKSSVAVLPFKLLTPNPEDEYLSVALADAIITQLSLDSELLVRPTSAVMRFAKPGTDPLAAAHELNVEMLAEGSIQKSGQRMRVNVQVWNVADGSTILSAKHDSDLVDLFGLQDKVADSVAKALGSKSAAVPTAESLPAPPTKNAKAYEFYMRAIERLARLNRWDMRSAIELFENATQLDPHFADAWARLAEACIQMAVTFEPGPQWFRKAEQAIRRALAIDPFKHLSRESQSDYTCTGFTMV